MMTKTDIERIVDERLAEMRKQMIEELQGQVESEDNPKTIWDLKIEDGEGYYRLFGDGDINKLVFNTDNGECTRDMGNAFLTREEAEFEREKRKIESIMRKYSRPFEEGEVNYFLAYNHESEAIDVDYYWSINNGLPYFESEEIVQKVIDEIGEDRLRKYWFGVADDE